MMCQNTDKSDKIIVFFKYLLKFKSYSNDEQLNDAIN